MNPLDALVNNLIAELPLEARVSITDLDYSEFPTPQLVMGKYMKYRLDQLNKQGNDELFVIAVLKGYQNHRFNMYHRD
jgi:hypothetical protein